MDDNVYAGIGGGKTAPKTYFYLVYDSKTHPISKETKAAYFDLGVKTGEQWVFIIVDNGNDNRLRGALEVSSEGRELFEKIQHSLPCFIIADGRLRVNKRLKAASVHQIKNYNESANVIYERMGVQPPSVQLQAIAFFRDANKVIRLNPNVMGIGVDLNAFFTLTLDRLENHIPKPPAT